MAASRSSRISVKSQIMQNQNIHESNSRVRDTEKKNTLKY